MIPFNLKLLVKSVGLCSPRISRRHNMSVRMLALAKVFATARISARILVQLNVFNSRLAKL